MANYSFDLSRRMTELGFDPSDITPREEMALRMALQQLVDAVYAYIIEVAKEGLKSTRNDYLNALSQIKLGDEYTIYLDEKSDHLENGYKSYDQKPGLLHGPSAKIAEDGSMYNIIPIQGSSEYGTSSKETTFRVVSSKSPSTSWIHPGFAGIHAFDYAAQYVDEELTNIIYRILGE